MNRSDHQRRVGDAVSAAQAAEARHGDDGVLPCPHAAQLFGVVHQAISIAGEHGINRRAIERALNKGARVLNDNLSAKPGSASLRLEHLARMILDENVLGPHARAFLVRSLCVLMGMTPAFAVPDGEDTLTGQVLDITDVAGVLAGCARDAIHPDSPGGRAVTMQERVEIDAGAMQVCEAAAGVMAHPAGAGDDEG